MYPDIYTDMYPDIYPDIYTNMYPDIYPDIYPDKCAFLILVQIIKTRGATGPESRIRNVALM